MVSDTLLSCCSKSEESALLNHSLSPGPMTRSPHQALWAGEAHCPWSQALSPATLLTRLRSPGHHFISLPSLLQVRRPARPGDLSRRKLPGSHRPRPCFQGSHHTHPSSSASGLAVASCSFRKEQELRATMLTRGPSGHHMTIEWRVLCPTLSLAL